MKAFLMILALCGALGTPLMAQDDTRPGKSEAGEREGKRGRHAKRARHHMREVLREKLEAIDRKSVV